MAKKQKVPTIGELALNLEKSYDRWKELYENGCSDPSWEDGVNLNLVRNHIIYDKNRIQDILKDEFMMYPDIYHIPTPPEVPNNFMSKDRVIPCKGNKEVVKLTKIVSYNEAMNFASWTGRHLINLYTDRSGNIKEEFLLRC